MEPLDVVLRLIVSVIVFLLLRELFCWYIKINRMVNRQDEIIRLLKVIAGETIDTAKPEVETIESLGDFSVGDKVINSETGEEMEIVCIVDGKFICYSNFVLKGEFDETQLIRL